MTIRTWACVRGGANHERPSRGRRRSWTPTLVVHLIVTGLAVLTLSPVVPAEAAGPWHGQVLDVETRGPIELALPLVLAMGAALVALEHWFPAHPIRPDVRWYVRALAVNAVQVLVYLGVAHAWSRWDARASLDLAGRRLPAYVRPLGIRCGLSVSYPRGYRTTVLTFTYSCSVSLPVRWNQVGTTIRRPGRPTNDYDARRRRVRHQIAESDRRHAHRPA